MTFGIAPDGRSVGEITLRRGSLELKTIAYGAIVTALCAPDRHGAIEDVVLGFDHLLPYLDNRAYIGAVAGRFANRIALGRFPLEGHLFQLTRNDGPHHLHGGRCGFSRRSWQRAPMAEDDRSSVTYFRESPAGEEGYPGTLAVRVTYSVTETQVTIDYEASTDAPTIVNLTQHSYFNLGGPASSSILDHVLTIDADRFTPVTAQLIPTGNVAQVDGTPFDFRQGARIGDRTSAVHPQLEFAGGLDHNFVLNNTGAPLVNTPAATLTDPQSGRCLRVYTSEPGLQLYDGHLLDGSMRGTNGRVFGKYAGVCLETQHFPDSPNHPAFPSTVLRPGAPYHSRTIWDFSVTR